MDNYDYRFDITPRVMQGIMTPYEDDIPSLSPQNSITRIRASVDALHKLSDATKPDRSYSIVVCDSTILTEEEYEAANLAVNMAGNGLGINASVRLGQHPAWASSHTNNYPPKSPPTITSTFIRSDMYLGIVKQLLDVKSFDPMMHSLTLLSLSAIELVMQSHHLYDDAYIVHKLVTNLDSDQNVEEYYSLEAEMLSESILHRISAECQKRFMFNDRM